MTTWTLTEMPRLAGARALVTGVTGGGLGAHVATELARAGAQVVLAGRNEDKLEQTRAAIAAESPEAALQLLHLDLADLSSVRRAAAEASALGPLDILVNNAGVMATREARTADGFDLQFGTNHLGHFALTGLLLESLAASGGARVVTVSSQMARLARGVSLADPRQPRSRYDKWQAYAQSKLANLLFTFEMDRRVGARGLPVTAVAAHPGYSRTNLVGSGVGRSGAEGAIARAVTRLVGQSCERGALPLLMAATAPDLAGGTYVGPRGPFQLHGGPTVVRPPKPALDERMAAGLWELSERATGVSWP